MYTRNLLLFSFGKTARQPILWNNTAVADDGSTKIEIPKIYVCLFFATEIQYISKDIYYYSVDFDRSCSETLVFQKTTVHYLGYTTI